MKTIKCAVCGRIVEIPDNVRFQKYCKECRGWKKKEYDKKQSKKRYADKSEKREWDEIQTMDTPKNIATCLDCPLIECMPESVKCKIRRVRR